MFSFPPPPVKNINVLKYSWSSDFCSLCQFMIGRPPPPRGRERLTYYLPEEMDSFMLRREGQLGPLVVDPWSRWGTEVLQK